MGWLLLCDVLSKRQETRVDCWSTFHSWHKKSVTPLAFADSNLQVYWGPHSMHTSRYVTYFTTLPLEFISVISIHYYQDNFGLSKVSCDVFCQSILTHHAQHLQSMVIFNNFSTKQMQQCRGSIEKYHCSENVPTASNLSDEWIVAWSTRGLMWGF